MKIFLTLLLILPTWVNAQVANVGGDALTVPDRFTAVAYLSDNVTTIRDPEKGTLIYIKVDRKNMAAQHFTVLAKVHSRNGGEFTDVDCPKSCKARYTEYKYKDRDRHKTVYLVEGNDAYYQIESDSVSLDEGREVTKAIFNQMIQKHIFYIE